MKNTIYKLFLSLVVLCFSSITLASECKEGQRTIEDWIDYNGTFKELALSSNLIKSDACFYEPNDVTPTNSFSQINSFVKKWKHNNNVRGLAKGHQLLNLVEALAFEFDLSLGQVCFNADSKSPAECEKNHMIYVSVRQITGENETETQKLMLGRFAG